MAQTITHDDYRSILAEDPNKEAAQGNLDRLAPVVNPDEEAEAQRISSEANVPVTTARDHAEEYKRHLDAKQPNLDNNPATTKFLSQEKNAAIAHDDVANLKAYEDMVKAEPEVDAVDVALTLPAGALEGVGMGIKGTGELYGSIQRTLGRVTGVTALDNWLAEKFPEEAAATSEVMHMFLDFENSLKWAGGNIKRTSKMMDVTEEERASLNYWQNVGLDVSKGTGQVAGQILTYIVNPALGTANLLGQGADQQAMRQEETGTLAQSQSADTGIITGAVVTAATEKWSIDKYLNRLPPKIKNRIIRNVTDVFIAGGQEALQEIAEGILQGLTEQYTTNPDAEIFEGLEREGLAAGGTGVVVRSLINMMTPGKGGVNPSTQAAYKEASKRVGSEYDQDRLETRIHLAQQSKVNKRAATEYQEFLEDVAPEEYVYIRPEVIADMKGLPDVLKHQLDGTGANVAVTMETFLTEIVKDEETLARFRPHIVMREDHLTQEEIASTAPSPAIQRMVEEAQKDEAAMTEADAIYEQVRSQLESTLRQGKETARMSAQLIPAMVVTQRAELAKMGKEVSVKALYDDMGLKIVGPEKKLNTDREVYAQDLLTEKDGKVGFKQDRIDYIIRENAYPDGRTQGFVAYVDPAKFVPVTTPDQSQRLAVGLETTELDQTQLQQETQTPFLDIVQNDDGSWSVDNHEGRHRMTAMHYAGVKQAPIVIRTLDKDGYFIHVSQADIDSIDILGGDTWNGVTGEPMEIYGNTALTWDNKGRLSQEFGLGASPDILYQRTQDFGNMEIVQVMEDADGDRVKVTEKLQDTWDHHQKRLDMIEALRKCLQS